jgi:hypothetical protein
MQATKLLLVATMSFTLLVKFAKSNEAAKYYDEVIYIETLCYRGPWLDAHHSKIAPFTPAPKSDASEYLWAKWIVRCGPGESIALESVRYPNHYLDAHGSFKSMQSNIFC